jgi:hypothetical protein
MKILLLIVLYNIRPSQSDTILSLRNLSGIFGAMPEIFVWINSPVWTKSDQEDLADLLAAYNVTTRHAPENASLSHIYNSIFEDYPAMDRIIIFDQDTLPTVEYFNEVLSLARGSDELIIPQVFSDGRLVSPGRRFLSKGYLQHSVSAGVRPSRNVLAINSGMAICPRATRSIRWDERLRFYGTDSYFMVQYENIRTTLFVTQAKLEHNLAMHQNPTREWRLNFASEMVRCNRIIYTNMGAKIFNIVFNLWIIIRARLIWR